MFRDWLFLASEDLPHDAKYMPGIQQPFYRIYRSKQQYDAYILDQRYANDRHVMCRAYSILEEDLIRLFQYVEPSENNSLTFSHRTYELLLRASTEFENNCKAILKANGYDTPVRGNWSVEDFFKIELATRVSQYRLRINIWHPRAKTLGPLEEWESGHSLSWYQDYNLVKHDRSECFQKASLVNVVNAVGAVLVVLYAQFSYYAFSVHRISDGYTSDDDGFEFGENSLFGVKPFHDWSDDEAYVFEWPNSTTPPFQQYPFRK